MTAQFQDKIALITGGAKGIGFACAQAFAQAGARVAIVSRSEQELRAAASKLSSMTEVLWVVGDVANEASVQEVFKRIEDRWNGLDYLVNNAAVVALSPLSAIEIAEWDAVMAVNVRGPLLCSKAAWRLMKRRNGGAIVNIGSLAGIRGTTKFPNFGAYTTSKFAVVGLTEALAVEFKEDGIRVNCVAPGAVDTALLKRVAPGLQTHAKPFDIARSVLFLCNPVESRCTTGTTLEIFTNL